MAESNKKDTCPKSDEITQEDNFLLYVAFKRFINHYKIFKNTLEFNDRKSCLIYQEIFMYVKNFSSHEQCLQMSPNTYSVIGDVLSYLKSFFIKKEDSKDPEYLEKEHKCNEHMEHSPTVSNLENSHVHCFDRNPNHIEDVNFKYFMLDENCRKYILDALIDFLPLQFKTNARKFCKDSIYYSFEECIHLMPMPLKEALLAVPRVNRMSFSLCLLAAYHYKNECAMFMSLALKLWLRAIDCSPGHIDKPEATICMDMISYLDYIQKFDCDLQVLKNCLRVYCFNQSIWNHLTTKPIFKFILEKMQKSQIALEDVFPEWINFIEERKDYLCFMELEQFHALLEFGVTYNFSQKRFLLLTGRVFRTCPIEAYSSNTEACEYRCLQILYLYYWTGISSCIKYEDLERALLLIWASTPESFLIKDELLNCYTYIATQQGNLWPEVPAGSEWIEELCQWYDKIVTNGRNKVKSPRSLQHLSRCTVRAQLRFPINVTSLQLSGEMKDYLMLNKM